LDQWIELEPQQALLYRWKGDALLGVDKREEALQAYRRGIEVDPENSALYSRIAGVNWRLLRDYPAAERVLREMAKIDSGAKIAAMTMLGQMFVEIGLNAQALESMGELVKYGQQRDPRVLLAMGGAYGQLGMNEKALTLLADVPRFAPQYPAASILMARISKRTGHVDDARKYLQNLLKDGRLRVAAATELIRLNLSSDRDQTLMQWADGYLSVQGLPENLKKQWLAIRASMAVNQREWGTALAALEQLEELEPQSSKYTAGRILLLMYTGKYELARRIMRNSTELQASGMGRPLAVVLGSDAKGEAAGGLMAYLEMLYKGDLDAARSAIDSIPPFPTVFKADLRSVLDRSDARSPEMAEAARTCICAALCNTLGMTRLANEFTRQALEKMPSFAVAQAMLIDGLYQLGEPIDPVLDMVRKNPGSEIATYVNGIDEALMGHPENTVSSFEKLVSKEPGNFYLSYRLAEYYHRAKQFDKAITRLESISAKEGPFQMVASNDLAYLLAERVPARMDEAADLSKRSLEATPANPAVLDTAGWIEHLRGHEDQALNMLNRAVLGLRNRPEVHYHIALVYKALENPQWAHYHLEAAAKGPEQVEETKKAKELLAK